MAESSKSTPEEIGVRQRTRKQSGSKSSGKYGLFIPTLGLAITLLIMVVFETVQLLEEKGSITRIKNNQYPVFSESKEMRDQFNSIAQGVAKLANSGNTNAVAIVKQLKAQGVTINSNSESMP